MKIASKHLIGRILSKPDIVELSSKLFQLGHEHEIDNDIFDFEFTPNRGDCLSQKGLLRELALFYNIDENYELYDQEIEPFQFNFINNTVESCKKISFLKVTIDEVPSSYSGSLGDYFSTFNLKKNNFFTDVSNFISYEMGQPTHCYDYLKLGNKLTLDHNSKDISFNTLLEKEIKLTGKNLVFLNNENEIVNLAGVVGGQNTACSKDTKEVVIECAYFNPEAIIGKSIKYDLNSEAAHKFERSTDSECHNEVLRRFLHIVGTHAKIKKVAIFSKDFSKFTSKKIKFDIKSLNRILGVELSEESSIDYLKKLGFQLNDGHIIVPSYRGDINSENDLAEELARAIGFDNIPSHSFEIPISKNDKQGNTIENALKDLLIDNGFFEVVNNPFSSEKFINSIEVDNPLDKNKKYLRSNVKQSLINNLLYNERRQQDSIKFFEVSNIYSANDLKKNKRVIGIIASGRVGKNYEDFSKKINNDYVLDILNNLVDLPKTSFEDIKRSTLDTKKKDHISYIEFEIPTSIKVNTTYIQHEKPIQIFKKYKPISQYPSSTRDLSFSIKNPRSLAEIEKLIINYEATIIKQCFIFDFFINEKNKEIKIGFRFIFESRSSTITDTEIDELMQKIIHDSLSIQSVSIPGLK